jgi:hypothetical protein
MHIRPPDAKPLQTPGYVKLPSTMGGPRWSIKGRDELDICPI